MEQDRRQGVYRKTDRIDTTRARCGKQRALVFTWFIPLPLDEGDIGGIQRLDLFGGAVLTPIALSVHEEEGIAGPNADFRAVGQVQHEHLGCDAVVVLVFVGLPGHLNLLQQRDQRCLIFPGHGIRRVSAEGHLDCGHILCLQRGKGLVRPVPQRGYHTDGRDNHDYQANCDDPDQSFSLHCALLAFCVIGSTMPWFNIYFIMNA